MIVVLTIIVTAFMQSMAVERRTASSYKNKLQAELAAEAAAEAAMNMVRGLFETFPDSATGWSNFSDSSTEGTVFFARTTAGSAGQTGALPNAVNPEIYVQPLISGSRPFPVASGSNATQLSPITVSAAFGEALTAPNSINLNARGEISGNAAPNSNREFRAKWVKLLENGTQAENLTIDATTGRPVNGPIARYAYWIEDESFRLNVNLAAAERDPQSDGRSIREASITAVLNTLNSSASGSEITSMRDSLPDEQFFVNRDINFAETAPDAFEQIGFYTTIHSGALNLTRGGVKRLNLNRTIKTLYPNNIAPPEPAPNSEEDDYVVGVRRQLDRIIAAISNPFAIASANGDSPDFGQRFYTFQLSPAGLNSPHVSNDHAQQYLQRIAANIRDYIDSDNFSTVVENRPGYPVRTPAKPFVGYGFNALNNAAANNEVAAIGKERVPGLHEYAMRVSLFRMDPPRRIGGATEAQYDLAIDHYFEFLNPYNQDIPVRELGATPDGSDVFLRIYNQFGWDSAGGDDVAPGRPIEIPLSDFVDGSGEPFDVFPAGRVVVFTTDAEPATTLTLNNQAQVFRPNAATIQRLADEESRRLSGTTFQSSSNNFQLRPKVGTNDARAGTGGSDYDTRMVLGNSSGVIDSYSALPVPFNMSADNRDGTRLHPSQRVIFRGGSLRGNSTAGDVSQTGDPRTANEQLVTQRYRPGGDPDQYRYFSSGLNDNAVPSNSSFTIPNTNYVRMANWPDYGPDPINGALTAPSTIRNDKLRSIGELGSVFDPSRLLRSGNATGANFSRGGGRSLRIGQSDRFGASPVEARGNQWDGNPLSASRNRAAWRLTDIFSTQDHAGQDELIEVGALNINGANRDEGVALRALFEQQFNSDQFVSAVLSRLQPNPNPFWERGEISELPFLNAPNVLDRDRERLVQRILEMICTRGNTFSVYAVGEAVQVQRNGTLRTVATARNRITFSVTPSYSNPLPDDDVFIPTFSATGVALNDPSDPDERFRRPDQWKIEILRVDSL